MHKRFIPQTYKTALCSPMIRIISSHKFIPTRWEVSALPAAYHRFLWIPCFFKESQPRPPSLSGSRSLSACESMPHITHQYPVLTTFLNHKNVSIATTHLLYNILKLSFRVGPLLRTQHGPSLLRWGSAFELALTPGLPHFKWITSSGLVQTQTSRFCGGVAPSASGWSSFMSSSSPSLGASALLSTSVNCVNVQFVHETNLGRVLAKTDLDVAHQIFYMTTFDVTVLAICL